jgi:hypothetical protein
MINDSNTPPNVVPCRYLVFAGLTFFPRGGIKDLQGSTHNYESDAVSAVRFLINTNKADWAHVYDTVTNTIIFETKAY